MKRIIAEVSNFSDNSKVVKVGGQKTASLTDRYHPFVTEKKREHDHANTDSKNQIKDGGQKNCVIDRSLSFICYKRERERRIMSQ